jgi:hypothetical protein
MQETAPPVRIAAIRGHVCFGSFMVSLWFLACLGKLNHRFRKGIENSRSQELAVTAQAVLSSAQSGVGANNATFCAIYV